MNTMAQGPTRLANVGVGAFSTWDAVHHIFPAIGWYWVLGVHKLLPQGPVGTECNLDGKGGQDPTDGLGQSTDVGESHRSTGHLVTWSPLIRLWAGVLVYETLGVTIPWRAWDTSFSSWTRLTPDDERASALHISVLTTARLWAAGWWE